MISDSLQYSYKYALLHPLFTKAFEWLQSKDLVNIATGKHEIESDKLFAIVQEYETLDSANEQMESHKKHIDIQYMIFGEELVGLSLLNDASTISKVYDEETDFLLVSNKPDYFAPLKQGNLMIFYPTDLHMPCIKTDTPQHVKKVVVKVLI